METSTAIFISRRCAFERMPGASFLHICHTSCYCEWGPFPNRGFHGSLGGPPLHRSGQTGVPIPGHARFARPLPYPRFARVQETMGFPTNCIRYHYGETCGAEGHWDSNNAHRPYTGRILVVHENRGIPPILLLRGLVVQKNAEPQ